MGGLIAGEGGGGDSALNGSITGVSATRIAAIIAGRVDGTSTSTGISNANDVIAVSDITTTVIGADLNNDGVCDDSAGSAWTVGDTNALIDGVVIVKSGGFSVTSPTPLKVVSV